MPVIALSDLITELTAQELYEDALAIAEDHDLETTSWEPGDPTRSLFWVRAEQGAAREAVMAGYVSSGFLDLAAADATKYDWLVALADQVYGYTATEATYAATTVTLSNAGGGYFEFEAGDVTVKDSTSGKTYHNTDAGTLASGPGTTLNLTFEADEAGSASSAAIGDIDTMVTTYSMVTCSNAAAAVGADAESAQSIVDNCRAKLGSLSPCGPWDAYDYVARNATLTGRSDVTRSRTYDDSDTGDVTQYLAGPSGSVTGAAVTAVEEAIATWALPLCITYTGSSASNLTIAITYELWLYDSVGLTEDEVETLVQSALDALFLARPIGGDIVAGAGGGKFYHSMVAATIRACFPNHYINCNVTAPASDTSVTVSQVPVRGTITVTDIHFEAAP